MNLDGKPNAEKIVELDRRWDQVEWAKQKTHDELMVSYMVVKNEVDAAKSKNSRREVKGLRTGIGHQLIEQDSALLVSNPKITFNVPDPENEKDKNHVNSVLEPWAHGAWHLSQQALDVWRFLSYSLIGLSRAWDNILPHPHLWATTEVEELVTAYNDAREPEKKKEVEKKIKMTKAGIWPIRWVRVPTQRTWTTFKTEYHLPEVIEHRRMKKNDIVDRWGEDVIPKKTRSWMPWKNDDTTDQDVIIWANWCYSAVIIPDEEDPKIASEFYHNFGRSPYEVGIDKMLIENETGVVFPGALYAVQNILDSYDELMSDYRENHRDHARTERVVYVNRDTYPMDQLEKGRPQSISIKDGMTLFDDEKIELVPIPVLGEEKYAYLTKLEELIRETQRSSVLRGQLLSGTSQNAFTTAYQVAERELEPATMALRGMGEAAIHRFFRSVERLDEPVPLYTDRGMVEVTPDDVKGWWPAAQVQLQRTIPIDLSLLASIAERYSALGIPPEIWMDQVLNFANPQMVERMGNLYELRRAVHTQVTIPAVIQRLQQPVSFTDQQAAELEGLMGQTSPDLQEFLVGQFGQQLPGNVMQSISNMRREGIPQNTQQPAELTGAVA